MDKEALRLWWRLNKSTIIRVVTGAGVTEPKEAGEILGQGSSGAAIISQKNLDYHVNSYFSGSMDEEYYGEIRLQPLSFMDDLLRCAPLAILSWIL